MIARPPSSLLRPALALASFAVFAVACTSGEPDVVTVPDDTTTTPVDTTPTPPPPPPPAAQYLFVAGNIASCGQPNDEMTAEIIEGTPNGVVFTAGDNAFPDGGAQSYHDCYTPTWGRFLTRTWAVLGNHEYDLGNADGAFGYFGDHAGPRGLGYYSMDLGDWHVIVLNDNGGFVPYNAGSAQETWLRADLAATTKKCVVALWHVPLFLSTSQAGYTVNPGHKILWDDLYAAGVDVVINGHAHQYERMAPMKPDGTADDATGIRQFNVGTGGSSTLMPTVIHPNSAAVSASYGVLRLALRATDYDWDFLPVRGSTYTDRGTGTCR